MQIRLFSQLDCLDTSDNWLRAVVVDVMARPLRPLEEKTDAAAEGKQDSKPKLHFKIHYHGWGYRWQECVRAFAWTSVGQRALTIPVYPSQVDQGRFRPAGASVFARAAAAGAHVGHLAFGARAEPRQTGGATQLNTSSVPAAGCVLTPLESFQLGVPL